MIIQQNMNPSLVLAKEKEYRQYIDQHINNVQLAYKLYSDKIIDKMVTLDSAAHGVIIRTIGSRMHDHDMSKYGPEEFGAYRAYFYPVNQDEKNSPGVKRDFEKAWQHHFHVNDHHPEFWVTPEPEESGLLKIIPMADDALLEMLMDWQAMSLKQNDSPKAFFNKTKEAKKKIMHEETFQKVEYLVSFLDTHLGS